MNLLTKYAVIEGQVFVVTVTSIPSAKAAWFATPEKMVTWVRMKTYSEKHEWKLFLRSARNHMQKQERVEVRYRSHKGKLYFNQYDGSSFLAIWCLTKWSRCLNHFYTELYSSILNGQTTHINTEKYSEIVLPFKSFTLDSSGMSILHK